MMKRPKQDAPFHGGDFDINDPYFQREWRARPTRSHGSHSPYNDPEFMQGVADSQRQSDREMGVSADIGGVKPPRMQQGINNRSRDLNRMQARFHDITRKHFEDRDELNSNLPPTIGHARRMGGWEAEPYERSLFHQDWQGNPEIKMLHQDGREAIYHGDTGQLVTDPKLRGTYNYFNDDVSHFVFDIVPYGVAGTERGDAEDPTADDFLKIGQELWRLHLGDEGE